MRFAAVTPINGVSLQQLNINSCYRSVLCEITFCSQINTNLCMHKYSPHRKLVTEYNTFQSSNSMVYSIIHVQSLAGAEKFNVYGISVYQCQILCKTLLIL